MIVSGLSVVLILLLGVAAIFYLLARRADQERADIVAQNRDLTNQFTEKQKDLSGAKIFQAQLVNLKALTTDHTYITPLLQEISGSTYVKAQYLTLDVAQSGKIHLEGRVANYADLGKLLLGLTTSSKFHNVKLLSVVPATGKENAYQFAIDLVVTPEIFTKK